MEISTQFKEAENLRIHRIEGPIDVDQAKAALIVSRDLDFGLSRMYKMLLSGSSPDKVMVSKDYDEAGNWLRG